MNGDPSHDASFGYDLDGLLTQAGAEVLTRDPDNGLLSTTTLGSVATTQTYNAFGELDTFTATDGGGSPYTLDVDRDDLGRITRKEETTAAGGTVVRSYEYDPAGRLSRVWEGEIGTGTLQKEYLYDANGNRLSEAPGDPTQVGFYDDQDRLTSYEGASYNFNLAGDLETKTEAAQTTTYTYDALGNLVNVTFADGRQIEYVIDGQNRRIAKKVCPAPCDPPAQPALERAWLYQDQLNPVAELDGQGQVAARFVYGSRPNVPDYLVTGASTYRILSDHLGSPRVVVDTATGAVAQEISYDAWGNPTLVTGTIDFQPFGFAGGMYDPDTGLVRFGARDYEPNAGRWTTKDPISFGGLDANLFAYALDDPLNLVDPLGQSFILARALAAHASRAAAAAAANTAKSLAHAACLAVSAAVQGVTGFGPLGNLAQGAKLTLVGGGVFGASVLPAAGAASAGGVSTIGGTGVVAVGGATVVVAVSGFYVTALGTTTIVNSINQTFGTNLASFSNTPSPVQGLFPNLTGPAPAAFSLGCGCSP